MIKCPNCGADSETCAGRGHNPEINAYRRRRHCPKCDVRFTTYELVLTPKDMRNLAKAIKAAKEE